MADDSGSQNRPEMVEAARKFMLTDKVRGTPFEEQRQFLIGKGVTPSEISEARASIPEQALSVPPVTGAPMPLYGPPPPQNRVATFAQSVLVIGSVSYAGYRFLRSYVLPKFFDIPDPATSEMRRLQSQVNELQNSMKFVLDSVSQTTQAVTQMSQREYNIAGLETGISTIKSLLLSHNNFAPIVTPQVTGIPGWQSEPPANAKKSVPLELKEEDDEFLDTLADSVENGKVTPV